MEVHTSKFFLRPGHTAVYEMHLLTEPSLGGIYVRTLEEK